MQALKKLQYPHADEVMVRRTIYRLNLLFNDFTTFNTTRFNHTRYWIFAWTNLAWANHKLRWSQSWTLRDTRLGKGYYSLLMGLKGSLLFMSCLTFRHSLLIPNGFLRWLRHPLGSFLQKAFTLSRVENLFAIARIFNDQIQESFFFLMITNFFKSLHTLYYYYDVGELFW